MENIISDNKKCSECKKYRDIEIYKKICINCREKLALNHNNNIQIYKKDNIEKKEMTSKNPTVQPKTNIDSIKYIDLFCGIGGFHQALTNVVPTSSCVLASDIDEKARNTYEINHKLKPLGDIKKIDIAKIPTFNLICGGFPCQAFSIAQWKDKKAFDDPRGTLFFEILKIIDVHKPKCILLENVAHLTKINKGNVLQTLLNSLKTRGYKVSYQLLSPHQFGVPQNRERVYIVATTSDKEFNFKILSEKKSNCKLVDILDIDVSEDHYIDPSKYVILDKTQIKTQPKSGLKFCGYIKGELRKVGAKENTEHLSRVHKQLMRIYSSDGTHPTLAASETSGRYHIYEEKTKRVRRLTLNECYKLMTFPTTFIKNTNKGVAYRQIGNSVCVHVVEEIIKEMLKQEVM
jgi:DNA (cytosine-5)-methyltransferase 1